MRQMNCPVCDAVCWNIAAGLYVIEDISATDNHRMIVEFKPHECPKEALEAIT